MGDTHTPQHVHSWRDVVERIDGQSVVTGQVCDGCLTWRPK